MLWLMHSINSILLFVCFGLVIVGGVGKAAANEIIIEYAENAEEHAARFQRQILSLDPNSTVTICQGSDCKERTDNANNYVKYIVRIKGDIFETRFETSAENLENESLLLPENYIPFEKSLIKNSVSSAERIVHLSALIQTRPKQNNNALFKSLGDAYFESSGCSYTKVYTIEIIAFPEVISKGCRLSLLNGSLFAYSISDICISSLECLPVITRVTVLLSYLSPEEFKLFFQSLLKVKNQLERLDDRVLLRKRAMELDLIDQDFKSLCPDIKKIFSNYRGEKEGRELIKQSLYCFKG
ncbi:hypothetical protein WH96_01040 [Kiloniella spongiae]|uniref:Uncharacterized protein n=1 Tax=Kiloniella spongiae TaxID=1489064 RepID=A0A0H2MID5_9PROT|nr:hypothetical protein [Kiloniella spongiae]KLN62153.1 hypothetical protein WH96_01040 [Kiloniella spongiae]